MLHTYIPFGNAVTPLHVFPKSEPMAEECLAGCIYGKKYELIDNAHDQRGDRITSPSPRSARRAVVDQRGTYHGWKKMFRVLAGLIAIFAALLPAPPVEAADSTFIMRPKADGPTYWLVKPSGSVASALNEQVLQPTPVAADYYIWAGGASRPAEIGLDYPDYKGMQPTSATVWFYANTGSTTSLRVETVACGQVVASSTVPVGQGFGWRSFSTKPTKLYCGPTGLDQRLRLRFTSLNGGDTNVRAAYVSVGLDPSPTVASVMAYNLAANTTPDTMTKFNQLTETIRSRNPSIVLLNEVRDNYGDGFDPVGYIAREATYPYKKYEVTAQLGLNGTKGVAVLSRYPIVQTKYHPINFTYCANIICPSSGKFGILQASIPIDGVMHEVFSLRFSPMHRLKNGSELQDPGYAKDEWFANQAGHDLTKQLVKAVPATSRVIGGGDFNGTWDYAHNGPAGLRTPWTVDFRDNSGLKDSLVEFERPWAGYAGWAGRGDYIFYRGPYIVKEAAYQWSTYRDATDHVYAFAIFGRSQALAEEAVTSGGGSMNQ